MNFNRTFLFHDDYSIFTFFKRNALLNTEIELIAIAAPATTGLSNPNAANGMPNTL